VARRALAIAPARSTVGAMLEVADGSHTHWSSSMTRIHGVLLSILCMGFAGATPGQAPAETREEFVCTSGPISRIISISANGGDRAICRVDYTKGGKTKTLWSASSNRAYCTKKALSLVTKLIQDNYSCKPESVGGSPKQ
jgi:hypothetical protein